MVKDSKSEAYAAAGVDVTAGYESVELIKKHVESTRVPGVIGGLGGFGGLFKPDLHGMHNPVFVSGTDGVGTKLKLAFEFDKHDTVGIDCVAMCVNDIICAGAKPMFFLDYIAQGKLFPNRVERIVAGIAEGCRQSGCALIGGETAEMPGFYPIDEYDLAGFAVGVVDEQEMLDPNNVKAGDKVVALASSGVHSNGFSLVRKIFEGRLHERFDELGTTIGEALLTPTKIYVPVLDIDETRFAKSICHVTGGGWYENMPRMLPDGIGLKLDRSGMPVPPVFDIIEREGKISRRDMYNTFNMGVGLCMTVAPEHADELCKALEDWGAVVIGECVANGGAIEIAE